MPEDPNIELVTEFLKQLALLNENLAKTNEILISHYIATGEILEKDT